MDEAGDELEESAVALRRGPRRSVWLARSSGAGIEGTRVVKRFHHPGAFYRLRDRSRARTEFRLLQRLHAAGLRVPRPLRVARAPRGWQVEMEFLAGCAPLDELIAGERPWPAPAGRVARALGRLLADLHRAGVDHADLHPGNVLVDARGGVWAVDFQSARLRPSLPVEVLRRDATALAASVRETLSPGFRARVLAAWTAALPAEQGAALGPRERLARELEDAGRVWRREQAGRARLRWTRESTPCRELDLDGATAWLARELPDELLHAVLERVIEGPEELLPAGAVAGEPGRLLVLTDPSFAALRERWWNAARLLDQHVDAARPCCLVRGAPSIAVFALPADAAVAPRAVDPAALGHLLGTLHDRGLRPTRLVAGDLWADATGRLGPLPSVELSAFDARPVGAAVKLRFEGLEEGFAAATRTPDFARSYAGSFRGARAEVDGIAALLRGGAGC